MFQSPSARRGLSTAVLIQLAVVHRTYTARLQHQLKQWNRCGLWKIRIIWREFVVGAVNESQNEFKVSEMSNNRGFKANFRSILASGDCPAPLATLACVKGTDSGYFCPKIRLGAASGSRDWERLVNTLFLILWWSLQYLRLGICACSEQTLLTEIITCCYFILSTDHCQEC